MTVVRTVDFDAFRAEQKGVPLRFKIGGDVYDLPSSLPAAVAIDVIRLKSQLGDSGEVPLEALEQFGVAIFGKELWDTVLDRHRVTIEELPSHEGAIEALASLAAGRVEHTAEPAG